VECVDWNSAKAFCEAIGGHLPSEAEWEYAARAATTTNYYCGDSLECLDEIAWYSGNSGYQKHAVKEKSPNTFGLFDLVGNISEWTADSWAIEEKVVRGGTYFYLTEYLCLVFSSHALPQTKNSSIGIRCAKFIPNCIERECGDNGCGGSCGTCTGLNEVCADGDCVTPDCGDKQCGDDGYGGTCGVCTGCGEECLLGVCVFTACKDKECGPDGCGAMCGTCASLGEACDNGTCCTPDCTGMQCGNSCGASCGACSSWESCWQHACHPDPGLVWVTIPAGVFLMGCPPEWPLCYATQIPQHPVAVNEFQLLETPVRNSKE